MRHKFKSTIESISKSLNIFSQKMTILKKNFLKIKFISFINNYLQIGTKHFNKYSMFYILAIIVIIFTGLNSRFLIPNQFITLLRTNSYIFIIGLPMLLVIVSGNIDLSVGRLLGFTGAMSIIVFNSVTGQNLFATIIITLLLGAAVGVIQGFMIGYYKIPAFIITLGGMLIFQGLELLITNGLPVTPIGGVRSSFIQFSQLQFPDINLGTSSSPFWIASFLIIMIIGTIIIALAFYGRFKSKKYGLQNEIFIIFATKQFFVLALFFALALLTAFSSRGLQLFMIYILLLIIFFIILTKHTKFGRSVYAIGGNKKAAELSGINSRFTIFLIFVIIGIVTAFGGIVFAGNLQGIQPNGTAGFELNVISSVFIGGASVAGGIGTIVGSVMGAIIIGTIQLGLIVNQVQASIIPIITGVILALAVSYDVFSKRKIV